MKHSTYTTTNQNYGKNSKYPPAKRDVSPNRLTVNNGEGITPRSRVRTYTSPIYEGTAQNNFNQNMQQNDYRMA